MAVSKEKKDVGKEIFTGRNHIEVARSRSLSGRRRHGWRSNPSIGREQNHVLPVAKRIWGHEGGASEAAERS